MDKPNFFQHRVFRRSLLVILILLAFGLGYLAANPTLLDSRNVDLRKFWEVNKLINDRFVGQVDAQKAADGAAKGLVESLGDPFSALLAPAQKKDLTDELKGEFEGIGAELTVKNQLITVVAALADSPAAKAGLKPNDIVVKIDQTSTDSLDLDSAVKKIRGPKGSTVTLTVVRDDQAPLEIKITRENIQIKSVSSKMIDNIGYIEIRQFGDDTVELTKQAVLDINQKKPSTIIIDLRNNPGGYLNSVAPVAGLFISPSVVVKERYKGGKTDEIRSTEVPIVPTTPLYVLVDNGSASAAEILAGALQDYKRATLVGAKTFGKGSVQDLIPLNDDSALRLTIAEWLTPNGRAINKVGIEPDVKVEAEKTADKDPTLDKTLELAKSKK